MVRISGCFHASASPSLGPGGGEGGQTTGGVGGDAEHDYPLEIIRWKKGVLSVSRLLEGSFFGKLSGSGQQRYGADRLRRWFRHLAGVSSPFGGFEWRPGIRNNPAKPETRKLAHARVERKISKGIYSYQQLGGSHLKLLLS